MVANVFYDFFFHASDPNVTCETTERAGRSQEEDLQDDCTAAIVGNLHGLLRRAKGIPMDVVERSGEIRRCS